MDLNCFSGERCGPWASCCYKNMLGAEKDEEIPKDKQELNFTILPNNNSFGFIILDAFTCIFSENSIFLQMGEMSYNTDIFINWTNKRTILSMHYDVITVLAFLKNSTLKRFGFFSNNILFIR